MKNKYVLLYLVWIGLSFTSILAQSPKYFEKNYGEKFINDGNHLYQKENGNYWVIGHCSPQNGGIWSDFVREIDANGNMVNQITYDYDSITIGLKGFIKVQEHFLLTGISLDERTNYIRGYYIIIDKNGTALQTHFREEASSYRGIALTPDGGVLLSGYVYPNFEPGVPIHIKPYLTKLNANYEEEWSRTYPEYELNSWFNDLKATPDGSGYYLFGSRERAMFSGDLLFLKIDEQGNKLWEKTYDLGEVPVGASIVDGEDSGVNFNFTKDGGFILSAQKNLLDEGYIIKLNQAAEIEWVNNEVFERIGFDAPIELEDGNYIVRGPITNPSENQNDLDVKLVKLDANGKVLWERFFGGERNDYGYDMILNNGRADGLDGFVICGRTESLGETIGANVYLIKTNCMGLLTEPQTSFSAEQDPDQALTYHFTNHSQYVYPDSIDGGHYLWDFGDGTTSEELHPSHTFANKGDSYIVTLTAVVCSDTSRFDIKVITGEEIVGIEGVDGLPAFSFNMYPNPVSNGQVRVDYDLPKEGWLELYDLQGRLMVNCQLLMVNAEVELGLEELDSGMYLYRLVSEGRTLKGGKLIVKD